MFGPGSVARAATWQATVANAVAGVADERDREALEEFAVSVALACKLATSPHDQKI
jgi:hypothetical protein